MKAFCIFYIFFLASSLYAKDCDLASPLKSYHPKYAKHFYIDYYTNFKIAHVDQDSYLLSETSLECSFSSSVIHTPVKKVVMMSTTYLPTLELLNEQKSLSAFQGKRYIVNKSFDLNSIKEVSYKFNPEDLLSLKSDLIMGYDSNLSGLNQKKIFKSLNLPVVINKDFEETNPLARSEWMIFISSFYNQEDKAIEIFKHIESDYLKLKNENLKLKKTKVIVGDIQSGFWITCGGKSDLAQMIADAGGELAFAKPSSNTQKISLEVVAKNKDVYSVWLPHNRWESTEAMKEATDRDSRYKFIRANEIYNNNLIMNKDKASDYWETAMQRPDLLLKDLSAILHPESFKGYSLRWYRKL